MSLVLPLNRTVVSKGIIRRLPGPVFAYTRSRTPSERFAMKITLLTLIFLLPLSILSNLAYGSGHTVYVSPTGNDSWSGTLSAPNKAGTDGPVASLERARDVARTMHGWSIESQKCL